MFYVVLNLMLNLYPIINKKYLNDKNLKFIELIIGCLISASPISGMDFDTTSHNISKIKSSF